MSGAFYSDDVGDLQHHPTQDEALAAADASLRIYRRDARSDGEWSGDVETLTVGRVEPGAGEDGEDAYVPTHRATAVGDEGEGYDYAMRPVPAAA